MITNATTVDVLVKEAGKTLNKLDELTKVRDNDNKEIQDQIDLRQLKLLSYFEMLCQRIGEYVVKCGSIVEADDDTEDED